MTPALWGDGKTFFHLYPWSILFMLLDIHSKLPCFKSIFLTQHFFFCTYRVFLVRDSQSTPGAFVLTLKCGTKVLHKEITPLSDMQRDTICYTLDSGQTKFYDLLQLVEFYQLNTGSLPTRLTHYLVQSPTGVLYKEKSGAREMPGSFWQCQREDLWEAD